MTPLTRSQVEAMRDSLRSTLDLIEAGELEGSWETRLRMEGAITALDVTLGQAPADALGADAQQ